MQKNKIYDLLKENGIDLEYDIYSYGCMTLKYYASFLLILIPLALVLHIGLEVAFFLICFIPLRRYIGGFHFRSSILCITFSILFSITIPYLSIVSYIPFSIRLISIALLLAITFYIKAVDHPNKRISEKEKQIYTLKAMVIEIIYSIFVLFLYNISYIHYMNILFYTLAFCVIGIFLTKILK